ESDCHIVSLVCRVNRRDVANKSVLRAQDLERTWLKVDVPALPAGNPQNLLTLRINDDGGFRSATTTKNAVRSSSDNVLTESNEKLDLFRWCEICNRHSIYENPNGASRPHETTVTLDDEAARVGCLR